MTISAASRSRFCSTFARKSLRSTLPSRSQPTTTTRSPGHRRAGRVGAMRRGRDQANIAMRLAARRMPAADRQQAGIFALRSGIRLQRNRRESGQFPQPLGQPLDQHAKPVGLILRRKRVHVGKSRQRNRDHLGGRVQLHRARSQRDHRTIQRDVLVFQPFQIAEHLVLGMIPVEHRLRQQRAGARAARNPAPHPPAARPEPTPARSDRRASPFHRARCRPRHHPPAGN